MLFPYNSFYSINLFALSNIPNQIYLFAIKIVCPNEHSKNKDSIFKHKVILLYAFHICLCLV